MAKALATPPALWEDLGRKIDSWSKWLELLIVASLLPILHFIFYTIIDNKMNMNI